jgi:hypothetical protein
MLPDYLPFGNQFAFWRDLPKQERHRCFGQRNGNGESLPSTAAHF